MRVTKELSGNLNFLKDVLIDILYKVCLAVINTNHWKTYALCFALGVVKNYNRIKSY